MSEQSSSLVFGMPFKEIPRDGQRRVFDQIIAEPERKSINVQLPTGYGKSFVNTGVYSILQKQNRVNRLLVVFPTVTQLNQFERDGHNDLEKCCVSGPKDVADIGFFGKMEAISKHRAAMCQVFAVTAQALINAAGDIVREMMQTGSWMITVDEYHHYGIDKSWGKAITGLNYNFLLAMSATPYRPNEDSAFGAPDVVVPYRDGVKQGCLKPLIGHSYVYKIDAILPTGELQSMTTDELVRDVGSDSPAEIENHLIQRKMRWSPKYVSPLVSFPIERMLKDRINTGHKLQAIIGAMCVSHAMLVCEQVKSIFSELSVDWVGTGDAGRDPKENTAVIERFCPKKDKSGNRHPSLDILVHVGMAGEGLDCIHVSEVVHLNKASINNSNNQENGRASRYLPNVIGNINFDSCSEYSSEGYIGEAIMDAMEFRDPANEKEDLENGKDMVDREYEPLPDEINIRIWDMELERIDSECPEVIRNAKVLAHRCPTEYYNKEQLDAGVLDPDSDLCNWAINLSKTLRAKEAEQFNQKSIIEQAKDGLSGSVRYVAGLIIKLMTKNGYRCEKTFPGDLVRRINSRKKREIGEVTPNVENYQNHYRWVKALEREILSRKEVPQWLQ